MTALRLTITDLETNANVLIAIGALAGLALAICAFIDAPTTARALLFSWLYWIGISIGSTVLLTAHQLTGGRWGDAAREALVPASRALFVAALPFIIIVLASPFIFPWVHEGFAPEPSKVAQLYLNPAAFTVRGAVILVVWSILGLAASRGEVTPVWAGIGLGFYMISVTVASVDWSASLLPQWSSSAYGALIGATQVTAALAFAAISRSGEQSDPATRDISGLLLAAILGVVYLGFMQYLVIWSSGLPEKTIWYELRSHAVVLIVLAFCIGGVVSFFLLIQERVRTDAAMTGVAGMSVLLGLTFFWAWQVVPPRSVHPLFSYPVALVAVGGAWLGIAFGPLAKVDRRLTTGASSHV